MHHFSKTILACFLAASLPLRAELPVVGDPVPELVVLDEKMSAFMEAKEISAGSLSVMRGGKVVFHHGYGWQDKQKTQPIRPDAIFRIASVTKPFTAAAIRRLVADGKIATTSKVFSLGVAGAGILDHEPFGTPDPRLGSITVEHLLQHRGGWDRGVAGDLTYMERKIAADLEVASPPGRDATIRWIMGKPLQQDPGSKYAYSNIGYLLLGRIIEKVSGQSYEEYVEDKVIGPGGSKKGADWVVGRSLIGDADPREPYYQEPGVGWNVFHPARGPRLVESPYGSFDMESRVAQGGIVTHGLVLLRYLDRFHISGDDIGNSRPAAGKWSHVHNGAQKGANALAKQRGDGINYAVLFNKRAKSGATYVDSIRKELDALFDGGTVRWPESEGTKVPSRK